MAGCPTSAPKKRRQTHDQRGIQAPHFHFPSGSEWLDVFRGEPPNLTGACFSTTLAKTWGGLKSASIEQNTKFLAAHNQVNS